MYIIRAAKRISGPQGKWKLSPPPPILQIMILKLSPPRCVISKEPVQKKWIDELWFRKQLSTCLFVWIFNYNSWAPRRRPDDHPLNGPEYNIIRFIVFFVGSLFATLSSTELLFTAFSQLIYGGIYKWSVSFFPGLVFVIMACVLVLVLILSM